MQSSSRPISWGHWTSDFPDFDLDTHPLEESLSSPRRPSFSEQQSMLANMAAPPTRPGRELDSPADSSSSSSSGLTPPRSHSPNSYSSTSANSQDIPVEAASSPSHLPYRKLRSSSTRSVPPSPLNPANHHLPPSSPGPFANTFPRPVSQFMRIPSEESRALAGRGTPGSLSVNSTTKLRGSMILYRYASEDGALTPPTMPTGTRDSVASYASLSSDSKYPLGTINSERGLIAYAYDPTMDEQGPDDEDDKLHDPRTPDNKLRAGGSGLHMGWRGFLNLATLLLMVCGLLALFVVYPVYNFTHDNGTAAKIVGNTRINSTGQAAW